MARGSRELRALANVLPSSEELSQLGPMGMLALIHDAVGHLITPVSKLPKAIPILEQVAAILIKQQAVLEGMLGVRKDPVSERFAVRKLERVPSLSHSVLARNLRFASVSESYCHLFEFSPDQLRGRSFKEFLHPTAIPRFSKVVKLLLAGTVESAEVVEWRATGSHRFVLTKDTLWEIRRPRARGLRYIATVSEKIADQDEAAVLFESAMLQIR